MRKAKKIRLGILAAGCAALAAGTGAYVHWNPGSGPAVATGALLVFGAVFSAVGAAGLWGGLSYKGSPSPSMGPGLGAAVALVVGAGAALIGVPLLIWGITRLLG